MDSAGVATVMIGKRELAAMLGCSPETIDRLRKRGAIPAPARLGVLVRWPRAVIPDWVADGCPPCDGVPGGKVAG